MNSVSVTHYSLLIFICLAILNACSTMDTRTYDEDQMKLSIDETKSPRPPFVKRLLTGDAEIGIVIDEYILWKEGDDALELHKHISDNLLVKIDDNIIDQNNLVFSSYLSITGVLSEDKKEILGSYSDLTVYVNVANYLPGTYVAMISTTNLSNVIFSYTFTFEIT